MMDFFAVYQGGGDCTYRDGWGREANSLITHLENLRASNNVFSFLLSQVSLHPPPASSVPFVPRELGKRGGGNGTHYFTPAEEEEKTGVKLAPEPERVPPLLSSRPRQAVVAWRKEEKTI